MEKARRTPHRFDIVSESNPDLESPPPRLKTERQVQFSPRTPPSFDENPNHHPEILVKPTLSLDQHEFVKLRSHIEHSQNNSASSCDPTVFVERQNPNCTPPKSDENLTSGSDQIRPKDTSVNSQFPPSSKTFHQPLQYWDIYVDNFCGLVQGNKWQ